MSPLVSRTFVRNLLHRISRASVGLLLLASWASQVTSASAQTAQFCNTTCSVATGVDDPYGVVVDSSGNVYVAAYSGVYKETPNGSGYISTTLFGGTEESSVYYAGIARDASGNLYLSEENDESDSNVGSVVKETLSGGTYTPTTIANNLSGPQNLVVDSNGNVFIAETGANTILEETPSGGGYVQTVILNGSQNSSILNAPGGVAVDSNNNLYIADTGNGRVLKETLANGTYTESVFATGLTSPTALAFDSNGNLFVAESTGVTEYPAGTATPVALVTGGQAPDSIATDANGNLYTSDTENFEVLRYQLAPINFAASNIGTATAAQALTFTFNTAGTLGADAVLTDGNASLDFSDTGTGSCKAGTSYAVNDTCTVAVRFKPSLAGVRNGAVVLYNSSGTAIATGYLTGTGTGPQVVFTPATVSTVESGEVPTGIAVDAAGNVFYGSETSSVVYKLSGNTSTVVSANVYSPQDLAIDGAGNLFLGSSSSEVRELALSSSGTYSSYTVDASEYDSPSGVAVDSAGNVYYSDGTGNVIYKETPSGEFSYTKSVIASGLNQPFGIAVDGSGNVYVADAGNDRIVKETPSVTGYTQSVVASNLSAPNAVAVDATGNLYVADTGNNRVVKETLAGGQYSLSVLLSDIASPAYLALDGHGNLYVADAENSRMVKLDMADAPSLAFASTGAGTTSADSPQTVTLNNIGNVSLSFPVPASGTNPTSPVDFSVATGSVTTCPTETSASSAAGTLGAGDTCTLGYQFVPQHPGTFAESSVLTDSNLGATTATQTVALAGTAIQDSTTITVQPDQVVYGNSTTISATISFSGSTPTGAVTVSLGGDPNSTQTATCTGSTSPLSCHTTYSNLTLEPSQYTITVSEAADTNNTAGTGTGTLTIADPTATVTVQSASASVGTANTTLNATVAYNGGSAAPGGGLTFSVNGGAAVAANCSGSATPLVCTASYPTGSLVAGTYTITATEAAYQYYSAASGNGTLSVGKASATLGVATASSVYGATSTTLAASLTYSGAVVPTGAVTIVVGGGSAATATCSGSTSPRTCTVSYPTGTVAPGSYTITATLAADSNYNSSSGTNSLSVAKATPTVTVSQPASLIYGASSATLTASVAYTGAAPAGATSFVVGSGAAVTGSCSGTTSPLTCTASYPVSTLSPGSYTVTVTQAGDTNYNLASGTNRLTISASTPTIAVNSATSAFGSTTPVTLSGTLSYSGSTRPSGAFSFNVNGTSVAGTCSGTASPLACTGSYNAATLATGSYPITASLAADTLYNAASSTGSATLTISKASSNLSVAAANLVYGGTSTALTTNITYSGAVAPTGAVTFVVGTGSSVTATCTGSTSPRTCTATYPTTGLAAGTYVITAALAADANYGQVSGTGTLTISKATPSIAVAQPGSSAYGASNTTLTATITYVGATPTGVTSFVVGSGNPVTGTCTGANSPLSCTAYYPTASFAPGTYPITVTETADANYNVASGTSSLTISNSAPAIVVNSATISYGSTTPVALSGTLSYGGTVRPTGSFAFTVNGVSVAGVCSGSASPLTCTGSYNAASLGTGVYPITATIAADATYAAASSSVSSTLTITAALPSIAVTPLSVSYGTPSASLQAVVTYSGSTAPTGNVIFTVNNTSFNATCTVAASMRTCTAADSAVNALSPGTYPITVGEQADGNYLQASGSGSLTVASSAATVAVYPQSIVAGTASTVLTAAISYTAAVAPSGAVTFTVNNASLNASCTAAASVRTCTATDPSTGTLAAGNYPITVREAADANYAAASGTSTLSVANTAASTPIFSVTTGSYNGPQSVTLSDSQLGATFFYTVDGTAPTTSSTLYNGAIVVNGTETINAIAVVNGYLPSGIASASYSLLGAPTCTLAVNGSSNSLAATVNAGCTDPQGLPLVTTINYGDGTITPASNTIHTYAKAGTYTIVLTGSDSSGLMGTASRDLTLNILPSVTAGSPSLATAIVPSSATAAQVTFQCSSVSLEGTSNVNVLPSQYGISCMAPTVTTAGSSVPVQITIQTTAGNLARNRIPANPALLAAEAGIPGAFFFLWFFRGPAGAKRRRLPMAGLGLIVLCLTMSSCAKDSFNPPVTVTPTGVYIINVTEVITSSASPTNFVQSSLIVQLPVN